MLVQAQLLGGGVLAKSAEAIFSTERDRARVFAPPDWTDASNAKKAYAVLEKEGGLSFARSAMVACASVDMLIIDEACFAHLPSEGACAGEALAITPRPPPLTKGLFDVRPRLCHAGHCVPWAARRL